MKTRRGFIFIGERERGEGGSVTTTATAAEAAFYVRFVRFSFLGVGIISHSVLFSLHAYAYWVLSTIRLIGSCSMFV